MLKCMFKLFWGDLKELIPLLWPVSAALALGAWVFGVSILFIKNLPHSPLNVTLLILTMLSPLILLGIYAYIVELYGRCKRRS